jgi:GxxExxY protein
MNADGRDGLHVNETEKIIGCAFSVLNALGHGFHEKPYEVALTVEFRRVTLTPPEAPLLQS